MSILDRYKAALSFERTVAACHAEGERLASEREQRLMGAMVHGEPFLLFGEPCVAVRVSDLPEGFDLRPFCTRKEAP